MTTDPIPGEEPEDRQMSEAAVAFFAALPPAQQQQAFENVEQLIFAREAKQHGFNAHQREATRSAREATELNGDTVPTLKSYEQIRMDNPERQLVPARTLKRWMGTEDWASAMRSAGLTVDPTAFGPNLDVHVLGGKFTPDDLLRMLNEYATERTSRQIRPYHFLAWATSPEVRARPGRRCRTLAPFYRTFGSWLGALQAAGLDDGTYRAAGRYALAFSDSELRAGPRLIAEEIGRSPIEAEYIRERARISEEAAAVGRVQSLPSNAVLRYHLASSGGWNDVLVACGLEPIKRRGMEGHGVVARRRTFRDEVCIRAVRDAAEFFGHPLTKLKYAAYRAMEIHRDPTRAYDLPGANTIVERFGSWRAAALVITKEKIDG